MKKLLVAVLLASVAAGGVFAQVTVSGGVQTDFGANVDTVGDNHSWIFGAGGGGTTVKANVDLDGVTAFVRFAVGGFHSAKAAVTLGSAELSMGYSELPWVQWSSLNFLGDNNWAFGSSASYKDSFIQFGTAGFYIGISSAGAIGNNMDGASTENWKLPGFYLGYDFIQEDSFSVGAAFAGTVRGEDVDSNGVTSDGTFPFIVNAHAKFFAKPLTIGVNIGFYGAPQNGFFTITNMDGAGPIVWGNKASVLEAMLDLGIALDPCNIGITGALVMNLAEDKDNGGGQGLRLGASADFNLGGGFTFTPGVIYTTFLKGPGGSEYDNGNLAIGATLSYSF